MQISQAGLELIKEFEGFASKPYLCPAGKLTIGYGHVIAAGENFPKAGISEADGEMLLKQDVNKVEETILAVVKVALSQGQFDAICSLAYNIGCKAFEKSTLLRYLNANRLESAGEEFLRWVYAGGVILSGLARRRVAEKAMFTGDNSEL